MTQFSQRNGGHGPWNPMHFHRKSIPTEFNTTEEMYMSIKTSHETPNTPLYNMRHVHPVRQSGPIPAYDGPWTMEDVKRLYNNMRVPWDYCYQSSDIEEIMRRVPGISRREAL